MTETVTLFLALLAVVAQLAVLGAIVAFGTARLVPTARRLAEALAATIRPQALVLALGVATVSMAGSLYFSEGAHFLPCKLCWYQRIAMYPLVPILGVAAAAGDAGVRRYALPLALVGAGISTYHVLLERFPSLEAGACDPNNPCSLVWVERFGYVTIPTMALSAFALIAVLLVVAGPHTEETIA